MRVCIDSTPLDTAHRYRGIGRYVQGLVDALVCAPLPFSVVQLRRTWAKRGLDGPMEVRRAWRLAWPHVRLQWVWNEIFLPREVASTRCCLFHATDPQGITPGHGFVTVATAYDLAHMRFPQEHYDNIGCDMRLGLRRMEANYRRADHLIAISEATKQEFTELLGVAPERISVVYPGLDLGRFPEVDASVLRGISIPERFFLYTGAADPRKNLDGVLSTFARIRDDAPDGLVLAGKLAPSETAWLQRTVARLGIGDRVVQTGYITDEALGALYRKATALVFPSRHEGFGFPVLEAMGCGCPVITGTLSSLPEVVGDAGLTMHPDDTDALADAMLQVAEDEALRAELRTRGLARAGQFTWQRCAVETLKVYEHVAGS